MRYIPFKGKHHIYVIILVYATNYFLHRKSFNMLRNLVFPNKAIYGKYPKIAEQKHDYNIPGDVTHFVWLWKNIYQKDKCPK